MTRTFVLGLDGASWLLLEPWLDAGELPNLSSLREEASWATSRSCLPPVTFPNWKCYSSGKNPGGFGVFWFESVDLAAGRIDVVDGSDFKTAELWDYLNDADLTTGVVNMPTMYPPRDIDGPIVCGGPDAVDGEYRSIQGGYTSPSSLETYLEDSFDYRVHPEPLLSSNEERGEEVEEILRLLDLRFEVALELFEREELDFIHLTLFYLNVLHHFFWDENPTLRAWKIVDERLGDLLELEDTNLVLMSDHGSAPTTTEFYINEWLASNGYLTERKTTEDYLKKVNLTRESILKVAKRFGLVGVLAEIVPERIQRLVPQAAGAKRGRKLAKIDLQNTQAVASGQGPIYVNPDYDVERVATDLIEDLRAESDTMESPLFDAVSRGSEVYSGPFAQTGPDVVVDQHPGVHLNDGIGGGEVRTKPDRWAAENTRSGIFLAAGPAFEASGRIDDIEITDIAPTILASHEVPVPTDMDGTALPILRASEGRGKTQDPIHLTDRTRADGDEEVAERLRTLGYME